MKNQPTPPWDINPDIDDMFLNITSDSDEGHKIVCNMLAQNPTDQANAALIVRAVNRDHLFDELLWHLAEVIELIEMQLKHDVKLTEGARSALEGRLSIKKDLLKRAKGEV
jgi:hypothetical protein